MPLEGLIVHYVEVEKGEFHRHQLVRAQINDRERIAIAANHTATHLLHHALREVLGSHVQQAGSSVNAEHLRFDYNHYQSPEKEELDQIERIINQQIAENYPVHSEITDYHKAQEKGAIALFGEKYGDEVRMIDIGGFSRELCGGTHVDQTSRIGFFKVISEQGIGSGLRRIEAVTREKAWDAIKEMEAELQKIQNILKADQGKRIPAIQQLISENETLKRNFRLLWKKLLPYHVNEIIADKKLVNQVCVVSSMLDTRDKKDLREAGDLIKKKIQSGIIVLGTEREEGKSNVIVMVTDDLVNQGYDAGRIIQPVAEAINGHGGGKKHFAQAGGSNTDKLKKILQNPEKVLQL